jgi:hypothetical protein
MRDLRSRVGRVLCTFEDFAGGIIEGQQQVVRELCGQVNKVHRKKERERKRERKRERERITA